MLKKEKMLIQLSEKKKKNQNKKNCMKTFTFLIFFFIPLVEVSRVYRAAPVKSCVHSMPGWTYYTPGPPERD